MQFLPSLGDWRWGQHLVAGDSAVLGCGQASLRSLSCCLYGNTWLGAPIGAVTPALSPVPSCLHSPVRSRGERGTGGHRGPELWGLWHQSAEGGFVGCGPSGAHVPPPCTDFLLHIPQKQAPAARHCPRSGDPPPASTFQMTGSCWSRAHTFPEGASHLSMQAQVRRVCTPAPWGHHPSQGLRQGLL